MLSLLGYVNFQCSSPMPLGSVTHESIPSLALLWKDCEDLNNMIQIQFIIRSDLNAND